jgi:aminoglycoside/choline kinase family phosphotransferase
LKTNSVPDREALKQGFLEAAGLGQARRERLAADASTRSYERLRLADGSSLMLMDAPPAAESAPCGPGATSAERIKAGYNALARLSASRVDAFVATAKFLKSRGLSAPDVPAYDVELGLAVLEDLGDGLFARLIESGADPLPFYQTAVDLLVHLHAEPPPAVLPLDQGGWPLLPYDELALKTGCDLFLEWWPQFVGTGTFDHAATLAWDELWAPIRAAGERGASVFTHRDYHAENLIWLKDREGLARVGLLDFQDAVRAHPAWDLLSLLQDARRDVAPELEAAMIQRYLDARPAIDRASFLADYAGLAALNNTRILGIFARLIVRDNKPRYRAFLPRMWGLLTRDLDAPALAPLKAWFDRHVPEAVRL